MDNCRHVNRLRPAKDHSILNPQKWLCMKCGTTESVWACLACPNVACGRYNEEHALQHFKDTKHPVAIEVNEKYVFCYECDEYVLNDNAAGDIKLLRTTLRAISTQSFNEIRNKGRRLLRSHSCSALNHGSAENWREDRFYTAILFRRLTLLRSAFFAWLSLTRAKRPKNTPLHSPTPSTSHANSPVATPSGQSKKPTIAPGVTGLRNLGNTCYMNSILQVLSHLQLFREGLMNVIPGSSSTPSSSPGGSPFHSETVMSSRSHHRYMRQTTQECFEHVVTTPRKYGNVGGLNGGSGSSSPSGQIKQQALTTNAAQAEHLSLCTELHALFRVMWSGKWARVSPHAMLYAVWNLIPFFKGYQQQDAQEFLCELLDKVQTELNRRSLPSSAPPRSPSVAATSGVNAPTPSADMSNLFQGELVSEVRCLSCGHKSRRTEPFMDLSLEFPNRYQIPPEGSRRISYKSCHIEEMLTKFTEVEKLDGKIYACEKCNSKRKRKSTGSTVLSEAEKVILINKLPRLLRFHLKRFRWSGRNHREKINVHVEFEEDLHMEGFCHPDTLNKDHLYRLSAVVMHHGRGFGCGHYTTYVRNESAGSWVHCNDAKLEICSEREVMNCQAYILFYSLLSQPHSENDELASPLLTQQEVVDNEITFNYKNAAQNYANLKRVSDETDLKYKLKRRKTTVW